MSQEDMENKFTGLEIAVIGMSGRFPGARNTDELWRNLVAGIEAIAFFSDQELLEAGEPEEKVKNPRYVRAFGWMDDIDCFDASFFDYTPLEAEIMDPQVRIFHECIHTALENAGYNPHTYQRPIGVYAGASASFSWQALTEVSGKNRILGWFASKSLNDKDALATRLAFRLNLKGPAVTLDSACSTSLLAVHMAGQGLICGDCDLALAGGVTIPLLKTLGYLYQEGMINSSDGHCRAFSALADGSNFGNAAAVVVLKRLEDALADNDTIHAVIKGSAINNDGSRKAAFTAPSVEGQAAVIRAAHQMAEVEPETIGYIETHGTGTTLGDPVEIEGLKAAFSTSKKQFCAIGSVKTNLGHLEMAAGATGLIKTVMALKHKLIPPSLFYENPNPKVDFSGSPFRVNTGPLEWRQETDEHPRRAGVSSFGIGGTNVHVVLEEWPQDQEVAHKVPQSGTLRQYQLLLLSAKTEAGLEQMTGNLAGFFRENPGVNLRDAAYTLQVGRQVYPHRRLLVCREIPEAVEALTSPDPAKVKTFSSREDDRPVVFMFPGLGSQYVNMGRGLYETEPQFRQEMDRCFELLNSLVDYDIKEILYPAGNGGSSSPGDTTVTRGDNQSPDIHQPEITQAAIFIFEYSLATLLMKWGITPYAMIGYSFGEYAAAAAAGVFSLEDALRIVVSRGQLLRDIPPGMMLSVPLTRQEIAPYLTGEVSLAIDNGPSCIVAGAKVVMEDFARHMKEKKLLCMPLPVSHALHTPMMAPVLPELEAVIRSAALHEPQIPYISNVTGDWLREEEALDPGYWSRHMQQTVCFADGMKKLLETPNTIFIEIGPGRDLRTLVLRYLEENPGHQVLNLVRHPQQTIDDDYFLLNKVGRLWMFGQSMDWPAFYDEEKPKRIPLPTYPFNSQPCWLGGDALKLKTGVRTREPSLDKKKDMADWFYVPQWTRTVLPPAPRPNRENTPQQTSLFFTHQDSLASKLADQLQQAGRHIIRVETGSAFQQVSNRHYRINPRQEEDYLALFRELARSPWPVSHVVHLWNLAPDRQGSGDGESAEDSLYTGFYSLIYLARAIGKNHISSEIEIQVITSCLHEVIGGEQLSPLKATLLGAAKVVPQEYPNIRCRTIDIRVPEPGSGQETELAGYLAGELCTSSGDSDHVVAYRNNYRWIQTFAPLRLEAPPTEIARLKKGGVYLITGGLGNLGFSFSQYLVRHWQAKLILTGRSPLPPENQWSQWLSTHSRTDAASRKISKINTLREMGGEVMAVGVDVADPQKMQEIIARAEVKFGTINGVIHAAGDTGSIIAPMQNLTQQECRRQFQPKIHGLNVLGQLFQDRHLDFCILISSLSPILGGLGFAAYSAANTYMDAFVHFYNRIYSQRWLSVNWGDWQAEKSSPLTGATLAHLEMTPDEGIETFKRILSHCPTSQVIVSAGDLQTRIDQWIKLTSIREEEQTSREKASTLAARPDLMNPYVPPRNQLEQDMTGIWQELFGFSRIGIEDDFFELGGDSLKAIASISRMHRKLDVLLDLVEFFKRRTIKELAGYIGSMKKVRYLSIAPMEKRDYYILSSAQQRLYILQQLQPDSIAYNESQVIFQEKDLDIAAVETTFRKLIGRHESLRASFVMINGQPMQRIHGEVDFAVEFYEKTDRGGWVLVNDRVDAGENSALPALSSVEAVIREFIRPFDLSGAPLLRVGLVNLGTGRHVLMVDLHHIITDGISNQILLQEFIRLSGQNQLPAMRIQYRDFAHWQWQNRQEGNPAHKKQQDYWLRQFAGEIPVLNLPIDLQRPLEQSFAGKTLRFEIDKKETMALLSLAANEHVTLYMKLLAIFYIFLAKLTGQEDIVVGSPIAGRRHPELEFIIGMFVNTLPMRNYPVRQKTVWEFLLEVKENTLRSLENQDYPFEELIEVLKVDRDMSRNPLFDTAFTLQNTASVELAPNPFKYENKISKFDLTLHSFESGEKLAFNIEYCSQLFKEGTIRRFIEYIKTIIRSVCLRPHQKLAEIEIISPEEKDRLLYQLNDSRVGYPREETLHRVFARQAHDNPDHIALIGHMTGAGTSTGIAGTYAGYAWLTYSQLQEKSDRLAVVLKEKGVTPDTLVGIMVDRSPEVVIGMLGILKAGGAYLPIDAEYPVERQNYMLEDGKVRFLVKNSNIFSYSGNAKGVEVIPIDIDDHRVPSSSTSSSHLLNVSTSHSSKLAYVIYTSGTTGKPKGALIEHRNVIRLFFNDSSLFAFSHEDVWTLFHSYCFDFSVWEMYGALLYGGRLLVIPRLAARDPRHYLDLLRKYRVTILNQTPSAFYHLLEEEMKFPDSALRLRYVIFGGEALNPGKLKEWHEKYPATVLVNMYGITETTVHVTYKEITGKEIASGQSNIGRAIPTLSAYVMDSQLQPQPLGLPGEVCVGGAGVCRGYLNRPELSADKFVINPYKPEEMLYRSGDLARWCDDSGDMEYLGRIDLQVKIRGYRVELGEIQDRLLRHRDIKEAVVIARPVCRQGDGNAALCAYFTAGKELSIPALKEYLLRYLPGYMVPAYFVQLEKMPLTLQGKTDLKSLPAPDQDRSSLSATYVAPGSPLEKVIAGVWQQVLNIKTVGVNDNYFDIGGNSLSIIHLAAQLNDKTGRAIPVARLFQYPTISSLAAFLDREGTVAAGMEIGMETEMEKESVEAMEMEREDVKNRLRARRQRDL